MLHALWIFTRIVAGIWLLAVFYTYAWHAYRLAKTDPVWTGVSSFVICILAFCEAAGWFG